MKKKGAIKKKPRAKAPEYLLYNLQPLTEARAAVLCLDCGWLRTSFSRHDFRGCPCPNQASVDGGDSYIHVGAADPSRTQILQVSPAKIAKEAK